jgi:hypothetical protein
MTKKNIRDHVVILHMEGGWLDPCVFRTKRGVANWVMKVISPPGRLQRKLILESYSAENPVYSKSMYLVYGEDAAFSKGELGNLHQCLVMRSGLTSIHALSRIPSGTIHGIIDKTALMDAWFVAQRVR